MKTWRQVLTVGLALWLPIVSLQGLSFHSAFIDFYCEGSQGQVDDHSQAGTGALRCQ